MTPVQSVLIVGGGTAGWMTAASLSKRFGTRLQITLIESSQIGTVGVGEATVPAIRDYIASLDADIRDVMRATSAAVVLPDRPYSHGRRPPCVCFGFSAL